MSGKFYWEYSDFSIEGWHTIKTDTDYKKVLNQQHFGFEDDILRNQTIGTQATLALDGGYALGKKAAYGQHIITDGQTYTITLPPINTNNTKFYVNGIEIPNLTWWQKILQKWLGIRR